MDKLTNKCLWPGWETLRLIGRGSYGAVYEVRRTIAGEEERAAVKCLSIPLDESEIRELRFSGFDEESVARFFCEQKERFVREYSTMARLKGASHIVYCDDVRTEIHADGIGWDVFIKMELLTPLTDVLRRPMEEKEVLRLGKDIAKALLSCHKENIIHRDVKPQNIFINREGEYKLGDFGVARSMTSSGSASVRTGTYRYMAPEVFHGERYGPKADLYSLGLVLYWLLNEQRMPFLSPEGKLPTREQEEQANLRRFRGEALPPPATGSEGLRRVVLKACAFDPGERYLSAEEMLDALEELNIRARRRDLDGERADGGERDRRRPQTVNRSAVPDRQPVRPPVQPRSAASPAGGSDRQRRWERSGEAGAGEKPGRGNRQIPWLMAAIGVSSLLLGMLLVFLLSDGGTGNRDGETSTTETNTSSGGYDTETEVILETPRGEATSAPPESVVLIPAGQNTETPAPEIPRYTRQQLIDGAKWAAANIKGYNTSSNTGVSLEVPREEEFLSSPFQAFANSTRGEKGTIYIMPRPDGDCGHLGEIPHGTAVTVLAERNGFCFFVTQDGRAGWNGRKYLSEP